MAEPRENDDALISRGFNQVDEGGGDVTAVVVDELEAETSGCMQAVNIGVVGRPESGCAEESEV